MGHDYLIGGSSLFCEKVSRINADVWMLHPYFWITILHGWLIHILNVFHSLKPNVWTCLMEIHGSIHGSTKILMFDASIPFFGGGPTTRLNSSEFSRSHGHQGDDENGAPHGHREEPLNGRGRRDFVHATGEPHRVMRVARPRQWPWRGWTMVNHR